MPIALFDVFTNAFDPNTAIVTDPKTAKPDPKTAQKTTYERNPMHETVWKKGCRDRYFELCGAKEGELDESKVGARCEDEIKKEIPETEADWYRLALRSVSRNFPSYNWKQINYGIAYGFGKLGHDVLKQFFKMDPARLFETASYGFKHEFDWRDAPNLKNKLGAENRLSNVMSLEAGVCESLKSSVSQSIPQTDSISSTEHQALVQFADFSAKIHEAIAQHEKKWFQFSGIDSDEKEKIQNRLEVIRQLVLDRRTELVKQAMEDLQNDVNQMNDFAWKDDGAKIALAGLGVAGAVTIGWGVVVALGGKAAVAVAAEETIKVAVAVAEEGTVKAAAASILFYFAGNESAD